MMFEKFFNAGHVAVIGASREPRSVGFGVLKSLLSGGVFSTESNVPFKGEVFPVNPHAQSILGRRCFKSILDIPGRLDLVVIAVRAKLVPSLMRECADKGVKAAVIISAGFAEASPEGKSRQEEVLRIARRANIRIIGPNCLGIIRPGILNASFAPCMPQRGGVAFFSQSGALIDSVIDWSLDRRYGFSAVVSMGNSMDVSLTELLRWADQDKATKAVAVYLEGLADGREFLRVAKRIKKPVVVLKAGRSSTGRHAVGSHTGSLAGSYEVYKAAFAQGQVHVAETVEELFVKAQALSQLPPAPVPGVVVVTNGGGAGVLCADHLESLGVSLVPLKDMTVKRLARSGLMHPAYSHANPLDIVGDALSDRYRAALSAVLSQKDVGGVIVIQTLQTMTESVLDAEVVLEARRRFPDKPVIAAFMGGKYTKEAAELLDDHGMPEFDMPFKSALAMQALVQQGRWSR